MSNFKNLTPQPFWMLSDYMQALQNIVLDKTMDPKFKESYELDVRHRIDMAKEAITNLEEFLSK